VSARTRTLALAARAATLAIATGARLALAQEFAAPAASPDLAPGAGIEHGLVAPRPALSLGALHVSRPFGLTTRSLIASAGVRALRLEAGVARTGDADLGWSSAGAAIGIATPHAGAALRGVARRDDDASGREARDGLEAGAGGWLGAPHWHVWASAPQMWRQGVAPPLARGLTLGAAADQSGFRVALEREAPRTGYAEEATYRARLALDAGPATAWAEVRDRPLRGGIGVAARVRAIQVAAQVDGHPVLDPTTRLAIVVAFGSR
jgi:hypothetical protein